MLPVGGLGLQSDDQKTHRFRAPRHRLRGTSTQQKSSSGYPPSDSSIALLMKDDSFRPENPCQEQVLLASVVLCATERAAQNLIRYRDGLRSSSYLRWISTSMMGVYVKITRHYSHNRFHPCHPTPGNMCHWRRRLDSPVPARFIQTTDRSDDNPFAMCPEHRHTTRDTARSSVRPVRKNVTEIKVLMELQLIS